MLTNYEIDREKEIETEEETEGERERNQTRYSTLTRPLLIHHERVPNSLPTSHSFISLATGNPSPNQESKHRVSPIKP